MSENVKKLEKLLLQALMAESEEEIHKMVQLVTACSYTVSDKQLEEAKLKVEKQYELMYTHKKGTLH